MAQLIDKESAPASNSLLQFFAVPPTQTVIDSSHWHCARPINKLTNDGPFKFTIPQGPEYMHLAHNYLYVKFKVVKPDGTDMDNGAVAGPNPKVAVTNCIGKTLLKQVKVYATGKLVYDSGDMYAYRAYLETLLNYNWEARILWLAASLYYSDTSGKEVDSAENASWVMRQNHTNNSAEIETMAAIHCDLFSSDKLLLSNTQLHLELFRNTDAFCLEGYGADMSDYKIEILDMAWYVKKMQLLSSVHLGLESALMKMPAKYPIRRNTMSKIHITGGRKTTPTNSIIEGQLPRRLIIGFVEPKAFFGHRKRSPFVFKPEGIIQMTVQAGGQMYPREPLKMDFEKNLYVRPFLQLHEVLGLAGDNTGNGVDLINYKDSRCLFAFDLTPEQASDDTSWQLVRQGSVSVHGEFKEAIKADGLEMLIYVEYDNLCMIDRNRNVYFDYSM